MIEKIKNIIYLIMTIAGVVLIICGIFLYRSSANSEITINGLLTIKTNDVGIVMTTLGVVLCLNILKKLVFLFQSFTR